MNLRAEEKKPREEYLGLRGGGEIFSLDPGVLEEGSSIKGIGQLKNRWTELELKN